MGKVIAYLYTYIQVKLTGKSLKFANLTPTLCLSWVDISTFSLLCSPKIPFHPLKDL